MCVTNKLCCPHSIKSKASLTWSFRFDIVHIPNVIPYSGRLGTGTVNAEQ